MVRSLELPAGVCVEWIVVATLTKQSKAVMQLVTLKLKCLQSQGNKSARQVLVLVTSSMDR